MNTTETAKQDPPDVRNINRRIEEIQEAGDFSPTLLREVERLCRRRRDLFATAEETEEAI